MLDLGLKITPDMTCSICRIKKYDKKLSMKWDVPVSDSTLLINQDRFSICHQKGISRCRGVQTTG